MVRHRAVTSFLMHSVNYFVVKQHGLVCCLNRATVRQQGRIKQANWLNLVTFNLEKKGGKHHKSYGNKKERLPLLYRSVYFNNEGSVKSNNGLDKKGCLKA